MIKCDLQYFGGRGASSGSGGAGTFASESAFENSLTGFDDPRLAEYNNAYREEAEYNRGLKNTLNQSIREDGYDDFTDNVIKGELRSTQNELNVMPANKTPAQLGKAKGLQERKDILQDIRKQKGTKGQGRGNVNIL